MRNPVLWTLPLLLTGFAAAAVPVAKEIEIVERTPAEITLTFANVCGAYPTLSAEYSADDNHLVVTYKLKDSPCAANESPRVANFFSVVNVEREAAILSMKNKKPELRVIVQ